MRRCRYIRGERSSGLGYATPEDDGPEIGAPPDVPVVAATARSVPSPADFL